MQRPHLPFLLICLPACCLQPALTIFVGNTSQVESLIAGLVFVVTSLGFGTLVRPEGKLLSGSVTSGICTRFQSIANSQLLQFFIQKVWSLCRRVAILPACPSLLDETPVPSGGLCVRCLPVPSVTE